MADANGAAALIGNGIKATQKFIADVLTEEPVTKYRLDDYGTIRNMLFDNVEKAVGKRFPLYNDRYTLAPENVRYDDPAELSLSDQKTAIMEGKSCTRRLRGSWVLRDAATGAVVSKSPRTTLMRVPYMTDRGTFIRNGHEYVFTNIMRLEPGVYTKRKEDEVNAQFNVKKGTGAGFNMFLVPSTGMFMINRKTVNCPAYAVLKDMGVSDDQMREAWGDELFLKNKAAGEAEKARQSASRIYNM